MSVTSNILWRKLPQLQVTQGINYDREKTLVQAHGANCQSSYCLAKYERGTSKSPRPRLKNGPLMPTSFFRVFPSL